MNILYIILKHVIWRFQIYNLFREIFKFREDKGNNANEEIALVGWTFASKLLSVVCAQMRVRELTYPELKPELNLSVYSKTVCKLYFLCRSEQKCQGILNLFNRFSEFKDFKEIAWLSARMFENECVSIRTKLSRISSQNSVAKYHSISQCQLSGMSQLVYVVFQREAHDGSTYPCSR